MVFKPFDFSPAGLDQSFSFENGEDGPAGLKCKVVYTFVVTEKPARMGRSVYYRIVFEERQRTNKRAGSASLNLIQLSSSSPLPARSPA
jgi:hypothetical protein